MKKLGIKRPILAGHSSGGAVALRYALEYPDKVKGLVLVAPSAYAEGTSLPPLHLATSTPILSSIFLLPLVSLLLGAIQKLFFRGMFTPNAPPTGYAKTLSPFLIRPNHFRAWAEELKLMRAGLDEQSSHYEQIDIPVTIIAGEDDPYDPPQKQAVRLHKAIPRSWLTMIPGSGHMVHHQHPGTVFQALREVFRRR